MDPVYIVGPLLLLAVVLAAVWLDRFSVPVILVALGLGLLAGSDVLGLWHFDNVSLANQVANAALVFILFHGGLATKRSVFRQVALPAGGMATWGVVLTAGATFGVLHYLFGWSLELSMLLAAVICSTDAAATFSILRSQSLRPKLSSTIEVESAANDPMAILLTLIVIEALTTGKGLDWLVLPVFAWKFTAGPLLGWLMARAAVAVFDRLNPQDRGYYYVLLLSIVLLTYGLAELIKASGMLAVFTAGLVMGNRRFIYQQGVRNFSAALSMIGNVGVFVMMGLLVSPRQWEGLWIQGILLFVALTFIARPVAVWLGTLGMRFSIKERGFMSWAGLRGAVPVILATYPLAAGHAEGQKVFNLVFVAVLLSVGIQGSTLGVVARRLGLSTPSRPKPRYGLELVTMAHSELDLIVVDLPDPKGRPGPRIRDLVLPPRAILTLVTRGNEVVAPTGHTRLLGWDQVTVLAHPDDEAEVRAALLEPFERPAIGGVHATRILQLGPPASDSASQDGEFRDHVVLLGHGSVGSVLTPFLRKRGIPYIVIEQDQTAVMDLRHKGVHVMQGHGEDAALLDRAGIRKARMMLVTTTQPVAARRAIEYAHQVNPELEVIARVHQDSLQEVLSRFPRTQCVQDSVELAYAMARQMLLACGVSAIEADALIIDARRPGTSSTPTRVIEIRILAESPLVGKKLAEIDLPPRTLVIAILRAGEFVVPGGSTEIQAEDALLVLADLEQARAIEALVTPARPDAGANTDASPAASPAT